MQQLCEDKIREVSDMLVENGFELIYSEKEDEGAIVRQIDDHNKIWIAFCGTYGVHFLPQVEPVPHDVARKCEIAFRIERSIKYDGAPWESREAIHKREARNERIETIRKMKSSLVDFCREIESGDKLCFPFPSKIMQDNVPGGVWEYVCERIRFHNILFPPEGMDKNPTEEFFFDEITVTASHQPYKLGYCILAINKQTRREKEFYVSY